MSRLSLALLLSLSLVLGASQARDLFRSPLGYYGPYTGGHPYSYNVAYSYGFHFSAADSWQRDLLAYPAGIHLYRPYGKPIYHRVFPKPDTPYISVPGPNGLPMLVKPAMPLVGEGDDPVIGKPAAQPVPLPNLQPIPQANARPATIRLVVPESAEVWVEKSKLEGSGNERAFQTPAVMEGQKLLYAVRARWIEGGQPVEHYRMVEVRPGEALRVNFTGN